MNRNPDKWKSIKAVEISAPGGEVIGQLSKAAISDMTIEQLNEALAASKKIKELERNIQDSTTHEDIKKVKNELFEFVGKIESLLGTVND